MSKEIESELVGCVRAVGGEHVAVKVHRRGTRGPCIELVATERNGHRVAFFFDHEHTAGLRSLLSGGLIALPKPGERRR